MSLTEIIVELQKWIPVVRNTYPVVADLIAKLMKPVSDEEVADLQAAFKNALDQLQQAIDQHKGGE